MKGQILKEGKRGFTLVELIVVIAILAILAAVAYPVYNGYIDYTHKGVDRATVGEIMNAVELADYAEPALFGENGGAMVVLSTDGVKVAGLNTENTTALGAALEDAFGEGGLASTKLSYDKWSGTANMNVFANLGGDNTQVKNYIDNLSKGGTYTAFAEDMEEYWDVFEDLVNGMNDGSIFESNGTGLSVGQGSMDHLQDNIIKSIVDYYNGTTYNPDDVIEQWKTGTFSTGDDGFRGLDLRIARNYSFISFAERKIAGDASMQKELEDYKAKHKFDATTSITALKWLAKDSPNKEKWDQIVTDYSNDQCEADAMAYLGLMEAAGQVQKNLGTDYKDSDFLDALTPYVGMVSNVLTGKTDLTKIKELAEKANGPVVIINATKKDGVLRFSVSPEDANPRENEGSTASIPTKVSTKDNIKIDFSAGTINSEAGNGVLALRSGGTVWIDFITSDMPTNSKVVSFTINGNEYSTNGTANLGNGSIDVGFGKKGMLTVKGGENTGTSDEVNITVKFEDGTSSTLHFTLWTID